MDLKYGSYLDLAKWSNKYEIPFPRIQSYTEHLWMPRKENVGLNRGLTSLSNDGLRETNGTC